MPYIRGCATKSKQRSMTTMIHPCHQNLHFGAGYHQQVSEETLFVALSSVRLADQKTGTTHWHHRHYHHHLSRWNSSWELCSIGAKKNRTDKLVNEKSFDNDSVYPTCPKCMRKMHGLNICPKDALALKNKWVGICNSCSLATLTVSRAHICLLQCIPGFTRSYPFKTHCVMIFYLYKNPFCSEGDIAK